MLLCQQQQQYKQHSTLRLSFHSALSPYTCINLHYLSFFPNAVPKEMPISLQWQTFKMPGLLQGQLHPRRSFRSQASVFWSIPSHMEYQIYIFFNLTLYVPCIILQCVDKPTRCNTSYKWSLFFIIWLYMFRIITSPSSGASSHKLYNVLVCSRRRV